MNAPASGGDVLTCVRRAVARHLDVDVHGIGPAARLGDDLLMDSLDVLAVIDGAGALHGARLTLNHADPERMSRLADLGSLTVEALADALVRAPEEEEA